MKINWILKMVWRDSRSQYKKLLLYVSSIILGTAALVSIRSISKNIEFAIEAQAKTLLGADLEVRSRKAFNLKSDSVFSLISDKESRIFQFMSMVYFEKTGSTRFSSIRALEGNYPFYGEIETEPKNLNSSFREKQETIIDQSLALQLDANIGDSIKIGQIKFKVIGFIKKIPGESFSFGAAAPRVYISMTYLERTKLIQPGSVVNYYAYFKLDALTNPEDLLSQHESFFEIEKQRATTVKDKQGQLTRNMENLYRFLNLIGFIALILGSIGVASSIHVYVKDKIASIAMLHCLGASSKQTLMILATQTGLMALFGAIIGSTLGVIIQYLLPELLKGIISIDINLFISWSSVAFGLSIAFSMAVLFAMLPILKIRHISPLLAIRSELSEKKINDPLKWLLYFLILLSLLLFAYLQTSSLSLAIFFTLFLLFSFTCLYLTARFTIFIVRKTFPKNWSYPFRQSLLNLFRPNNQTVTMVTAIGLGVFLINTMYLSQESLINFIKFDSDGERPNIVVFDIQSDQLKGVIDILEENKISGIKSYPIVTMRISKLRDLAVDSILADTTSKIPKWALNREHRATYRNTLLSSETITEGEFNSDYGDSIFISVESGIAKNLDLELKDEIIFDVQGFDLKTYVGSIRKVEWRRVQPNFFFVFPKSALETAPQINIVSAKTNTKEESNQIQKDLVKSFSNVSIIDISLVIAVVEDIVNKIAYVIRFMALFSILTGITVLISAIANSRFQRQKENVLLRTLGASKSQIKKILFGEYFFLGSLSVISGLVLSIFSSFLLITFVFKTVFNPAILPFLFSFLFVTSLILIIGITLNRETLNRSPLEVLRNE
jgi:putative ABC transport system permease protein